MSQDSPIDKRKKEHEKKKNEKISQYKKPVGIFVSVSIIPLILVYYFASRNSTTFEKITLFEHLLSTVFIVILCIIVVNFSKKFYKLYKTDSLERELRTNTLNNILIFISIISFLMVPQATIVLETAISYSSYGDSQITVQSPYEKDDHKFRETQSGYTIEKFTITGTKTESGFKLNQVIATVTVNSRSSDISDLEIGAREKSSEDGGLETIGFTEFNKTESGFEAPSSKRIIVEGGVLEITEVQDTEKFTIDLLYTKQQIVEENTHSEMCLALKTLVIETRYDKKIINNDIRIIEQTVVPATWNVERDYNTNSKLCTYNIDKALDQVEVGEEVEIVLNREKLYFSSISSLHSTY